MLAQTVHIAREGGIRGFGTQHFNPSVHCFYFLYSGSIQTSSPTEGFSTELKYDDLLGKSRKRAFTQMQ